MPTPGSVSTNCPSGLTVIGPAISHRPVSWLKLHNALLESGGSRRPVTGSGRFGKRTGTGRSKLLGPSVWRVITIGRFNPGGSGSGKRSEGTGAMPTRPPRVPLSLNNEFAGTVIETPAIAGLLLTTEAGKVMTVFVVMLTGWSVPWMMSGR